MRAIQKIFFMGLAVLILLAGVVGTRHSLVYVHGAPEDQYGLWMGVLKPLGGDVYYVGSEGDYSFFRGHGIFGDRYKAQTSKLRLPHTFSFGRGTPYRVTLTMIPES